MERALQVWVQAYSARGAYGAGRRSGAREGALRSSRFLGTQCGLTRDELKKIRRRFEHRCRMGCAPHDARFESLP